MKSNVITIDQDEIVVRVSAEHDFLLNSQEVAFGYGVTSDNIRRHKSDHADELVEGKHWVVSITHTLGGKQESTLWTKRGIIRLGFFIRSERAKRFRDAAEDLIVGMSEKPAPKSDQTVARMLELVGGLLGLGYAQADAADTALRMIGNGRAVKRESSTRPSQYPVSAILDILGNREITWTQLQTECLEKLGMCDRTFDRKLAQAVESGRIVRILGLYSALRQEARA
jgi:hypothetical protein